MNARALERVNPMHGFLVLGLVLWLWSVQKPAVPQIPVVDIAVVDVVTAVAKGAMVIDVRSRDTYAEGHIAGAISMPLDELKRRAPELAATTTEYVVYCGNGSNLGPQAARALTAAGHPSTRNLAAGYSGWKAAGHAVATGAK